MTTDRATAATAIDQPETDTSNACLEDANASVVNVLGNGPLEVVISGIRQLTPHIRAYEFRLPNDEDLPEVTAGSHIEVPVVIKDGSLESRSYSISSNPSRRDIYEIAVLREQDGSGGSRYVHDHYQLGQTLRLGMPANGFKLSSDLGPSVLIAGGIGITPVKAMTQELIRRGTPFHLHFAAKSKSMMAYRYKLQAMLEKNVTFYASDEGRRMDLKAILSAADNDAMFYVCGPDRLIDSVLECADELGIEQLRIRYEHFTPVAPMESDQEFTVHIQSSGQTLTVPADETLLDTLLDNGIDVDFGCQSGACGTCTVNVVDGAPDHRDTTLSDDDRSKGIMCACVSRAKTASLTLDL